MSAYNRKYTKPKPINLNPEIEIILSKQDTIFTDDFGERNIFTRIQTNNRVYWMFKDNIVEDNLLEELYKVVNRDSKIENILTNEQV